MPWDFILSLPFLITAAIVLLPFAILAGAVWRTWNPVTKELE